MWTIGTRLAVGADSAIDLADATVSITGATLAPAAAGAMTVRAMEIVLVPSTEPSVVFASLAAQCVPDWCDWCAVDIAEGESRYRLTDPTSRRRRSSFALDTQTLRVPFALDARAPSRVDEASVWPADDTHGHEPYESHESFRGVALFGWRQRQAAARDRLGAALLVDNALHTVARERSDQTARAHEINAAHLRTALENSRHIGVAIGILMSLHKTTEQHAFDLLSTASQHSQRKVRDLAVGVIETGWLDPVLLPPRRV